MTLLLGVFVNAFVLTVYYERRQAEQVGQLAAEVATVAIRIGRPAAALAREGDDRRAREVLDQHAAQLGHVRRRALLVHEDVREVRREADQEVVLRHHQRQEAVQRLADRLGTM